MRSGPYLALRPRPGAISHRPLNPSSEKRSFHKRTVLRFTSKCAAMAASDSPWPAARIMLQRRATVGAYPKLPATVPSVFPAPLKRQSAVSGGACLSVGRNRLYVQLFVGHYTRQPTTGSELSLMLFRNMSSSETTGNFSAAYTQYFTENTGLQLRIKVSAFPLSSHSDSGEEDCFRGLTTVCLRYDLLLCSPSCRS